MWLMKNQASLMTNKVLKTQFLQLFLTEGVGVASLLKIYSKLEADCVDLSGFSVEDFNLKFGLSFVISAKVVDGLKNFQGALAEELFCEKNDIKIVFIQDLEYPFDLKQIKYPPPFLFVRGSLNFSDNEWLLGVVGARNGDAYGKRFLHSAIPDLVASGAVIVSGGALGIDSFAHEATLTSLGKTVVVLGGGLNKIYPKENQKLFDKIVSCGGAVISIFSSNTIPEKFNFPARNRVISGLSKGCLVVQAAKSSGSLITAKFALEQNREVFAVPGLFDSPLSEGCVDLLKEGARITTCAQDIFEVFSLRCDVNTPPRSDAQVRLEPQTDSERLLDMLKKEAKSQETIAELLGFSENNLIDLLFELECEGKIRQNINGTWEVVD